MKINFFLFSFFLIFSNIDAQIKVASALGDNMVLQRNSEVKIWGTSKPDSRLTVSADWNKTQIKTISNSRGEWIVTLKTGEAGGPYLISISDSEQKLKLSNILLGEVWLCSGQSNMEMPMLGIANSPVNNSNEAIFNADNNNIRLFTVKQNDKLTPQDSCQGSWSAATSESVSKFSAVAYYFSLQLYKKLNVPIGIICSSYGGSRIEAWMDSETLAKFPKDVQLKAQNSQIVQHKASVLFNGMIHPLKNCVFKGVLWYQGESNREDYKDYADLMGGMVENWRNTFNNGSFPFYYVQIAPYSYENSSAILNGRFWEEQQKAAGKIQNSGMVSTIDLGEEKNLHPAEKEIIGKRLSYWAVGKTYDVKGIHYKSASFKESLVKDSSMVLIFENETLGFTSYGHDLSNFEIAGEDRIFYPAKAVINTARRITVSAKEVSRPAAVRYCFKNFPQGNGFLYNAAGLPVMPFRTDIW
ncbi:sialate O-acetylesterase [Flavobacterium luteolum]|uniref:sialate O-acetylesterase n=1 Tax=Flavobacterium luteolum TaxID=3003259 RepID=UPI00248DE07D|nr:sialate O-acetylesterase [Flavobacterium luteolum]